MQICSARQVLIVEWDLSAWLPVDPSEAADYGVTGGCWRTIFRQPQFTQMFREILGRPADVVMLHLRVCKRRILASVPCQFVKHLLSAQSQRQSQHQSLAPQTLRTTNISVTA